jgi:glycosyltransferase involved in cell wall biosynthesis
MRSIKVAHIANFDIGLRVHLGNYMLYLRDQGYDVSAVSHPGRWLSRDTTILGGIFVKIIPFEPRVSPLADLRTTARLVRYFRKEKFDIVHTHTVKPGLLGRLAAKLAGVPIIVHTVHGFYFYEETPRLARWLYGWAERLGAGWSDLILSQNKADIETAVSQRICPREKICHLGNGIDLSRFDPEQISPGKIQALRTELQLKPQQPVVAFVGRLVPEKGIAELLEAARLLTSEGLGATFVVVGTATSGDDPAGPYRALVREYGIEAEVAFLGYREDVAEILSLADVLALPSYGREGIPRVLMESAALGRPVVATRVRGNIEAVQEGQTGLLVPPRDAAALAAGIGSLLRDPDCRAAMGRQARQWAVSHFDERLFFWKTDVEYRKLVSDRLGWKPSERLRPIRHPQA